MRNGTLKAFALYLSANRYCTMNYLMSLEDHTCWVIFIVKVSRIPSHSQYIGFQGGEDRVGQQLLFHHSYFHDCSIMLDVLQ